jgi:lipopolysaccharide biosynthesis glycosyltransferase
LSRNIVFFCADSAYLPIAWTAARTAAAEPGRDFDVLILTDVPHPPPPPGCRITQMELPAALAAWPRPPHAAAIAYLRLAAAELLTEYDRAVYIDSDVSIHGPLAPLFTLDLGSAMLAMAEDCGRYLRDPAEQLAWNNRRALMGMDPASPYYNSGIIVMHLPKLRAARFWQQAQDYVAAHGDELVFMDQDVLNVRAAGQIAELSPRWNFTTHYFGLGLEPELQPVIRHYADVLKPWRDPEWQTLYGMAAPRHFARLFRNSPWPNYMPRGLYAKLCVPGQAKAALRHAQQARRLAPEYLAGHLEKYLRIRADLRISVREGLQGFIGLA